MTAVFHFWADLALVRIEDNWRIKRNSNFIPVQLYMSFKYSPTYFSFYSTLHFFELCQLELHNRKQKLKTSLEDFQYINYLILSIPCWNVFFFSWIYTSDFLNGTVFTLENLPLYAIILFTTNNQVCVAEVISLESVCLTHKHSISDLTSCFQLSG